MRGGQSLVTDFLLESLNQTPHTPCFTASGWPPPSDLLAGRVVASSQPRDVYKHFQSLLRIIICRPSVNPPGPVTPVLSCTFDVQIVT
jgi:hypothetical protein